MTNDAPNIVVVFTDQQNIHTLTDPDFREKLPNISRLMKSGVSFDNSICATPQCTPSRGAFLTGLYPHKTGVVTNIGAGCKRGAENEGIDLPARFKTAGDYFTEAGYDTAYFGKWHLGGTAWGKGFDRYATDSSRAESTEPLPHDFIQGTGDFDAIACDLSVRFLREPARRRRPFALYTSFINPHDCYLVPGVVEKGRQLYPDVDLGDVEHHELPVSYYEEAYRHPLKDAFMHEDQGTVYQHQPEKNWKRYRAFYLHMMRGIDQLVGRILEALEEARLLENTLVVFTSDHGDMETAHGLIYKGPFMYRELVNVPLVVSFPGTSYEGWTSNALVNNLDVLPTLLDFAGCNIEDQVDGRSFGDIIRNRGGRIHDFVVSEYYGKQRWVNPIRTLITERFKYSRYLKWGEELFDLVRDPHELRNVAQDPDFERIKRDLAARLERWMHDHDDPFETLVVTDRQGRIVHAGKAAHEMR